jgi:hypothetical protein
MPIFRFHRGSLAESMETCCVVNDKNELAALISRWNGATEKESTNEDGVWIGGYCSPEDLIISPYCFDKRIGWNTHIVVRKSRCVTQDDYV